ncbi:branched-chain amino acid transport system II carrier protein [Endozoicomonas sp. OPT23]|uniref:branched-chain amino acid transport system II carrier protein n=1 Tax=Endozoicomonas sp. OPT23 TaxID=2072845 RepID=UPI001E593551|nr:branched-chain amino acid transport system II carrier protein [Endozoicomonas sp. OPT23]
MSAKPFSLKSSDVVAVGLMTFALFLGAGNMIFPPILGQQAGSELFPALAGFLLTGVGLPLLGVIAAARLGGGLDRFTQDLPKGVALVTGIILYLAIGPLFAAPRTGIVAYEMGVAPFLSEGSNALSYFSVAFFAVALVLALNPGKLIDFVGKLITPMLVLVLLAIALGVFLFPQGEIRATTDMASPLIKGFKEGYQTMDTLGALVFGIVIISSLRQRGVTDNKQITRYTIQAGLIAAVGLCLVYMTLGYLGATSIEVAPEATNGAEILTAYVYASFGQAGLIALALCIVLACLTTAVGLMTACGEYFSKVMPFASYRVWVIGCTLVSALIANVGLNELLSLTIPALYAIYPVAITLILLCLVRERLANPGRTFLITLLPVAIIGLTDGLVAGQIEAIAPFASLLAKLPLAEHDLGWMLPGLLAFTAGVLTTGKSNEECSIETAAV